MSRNDEIAAARRRLTESRRFFWRPPFGYFEQPPLTEERVARAEELLGVRLPAAHLAILYQQNGGTPRYNAFDPPAQPGPRRTSSIDLEHVLGIGPAAAKGYSITLEDSARWITDSDRGRDPCLADTSVLLAYDASWWLGLDYRECGRDGEPTVIRVDNARPDGPGRVIEIAKNLEHFLLGLYDDTPKYAFGFVAVGEDSKALLESIQSGFATKFRRAKKPRYPEPGQRDQPGYVAEHGAWHCGLLPGATRQAATLELERNAHARAGYFEFPQHPECDWILECDIHGDFRDALTQTLEDVPFDIVVLRAPDWQRLGMTG